MVMKLKDWQALGFEGVLPLEMNGRASQEIQQSLNVPEDNQYNPCPEAIRDETIPQGSVLRIKDWSECKVWPETSRTISIYTPPGFDPSGPPPAFAFFNDGDGYLARGGPVRATHVLDTLIHAGELPPVVAVFVMPGTSDSEPKQRSIEYDSINADFLTFINTQIVPMVQAHIGCALDPAPHRRLICGISSGGICAFNAAWQDPTSFGLVLSHCGSFTNIRGGHNYPGLIRRTPRKALKVFLTSGKRDANIIPGSWPIANKDMAASLDYAGYDYRFEFGEGGHSLRHGGAIFADALRWLFAENKG